MKKLILMMLLTTLVAFGQQNGSAGHQHPKSLAKVLSRAEFDNWLAKPDQVLIIDVRRPDEIKDIGGFPVYLNVQIGDLEKSLPWIPKERTIITVSNHAGRAGHAADILTKNGYNVAGAIGAQTYEKDGGTLAKVVVPPPSSTTNTAKKAE
jgi:rhodanese-related sulfurtransferase